MKTPVNAATRKARWNGMNWIRQEKRLAIYMRDGMACVYCSDAVEDGAQLTLDHVIAVERGGGNEAMNLVTACDRCNKAKGERNLAEFIRATAAYLNQGAKSIEIHKHVWACMKRALPLEAAKQMIELRGSAARAVAAHREQNRKQQ